MEAVRRRYIRLALLTLCALTAHGLSGEGNRVFPYRPESPVLFSWEDGEKAWMYTLKGTLGYWDRSAREYRGILNQPSGAGSLFQGFGSTRVGLVSHGEIQIWDWAEERLILELDPGGVQGTPALSPDGTILAFAQSDLQSGSTQSFVTVMDLNTKKVFRRFPGMEAPLSFRTSGILVAKQSKGSYLALRLLEGMPDSAGAQEAPRLPAPVPPKVLEDIPQGASVNSLTFSERGIQGEFGGISFLLSLPEGEFISPVPAPSDPTDPAAPQAAAGLKPLTVQTLFNHRLLVEYALPGTEESLQGLYDPSLLQGGLTALAVAPSGQFAVFGDDLGQLLLWNIPVGHAAGLWDLMPLLSGLPPRELLSGPRTTDPFWDPVSSPFPSGIRPPQADSWKSGQNGVSGRSIPWTDQLPEILTTPPRNSPDGQEIVSFRLPGLSHVPGPAGMARWLETYYILSRKGDNSVLTRLPSGGLPEVNLVLPGAFTALRVLGEGNLLLTGTESVPGSGGRYRLLVLELTAGLEFRSAYRSFFQVAGEPQVLTARDSPWVGFFWNEKSRNSWVSTFSFFHFDQKRYWEIRIPLSLDLSGQYQTGRPEQAVSSPWGTFLVPLSSSFRGRTREAGTTLVEINPENRSLQGHFLSQKTGEIPVVFNALEPSSLGGFTSRGLWVWESGKGTRHWSLPEGLVPPVSGETWPGPSSFPEGFPPVFPLREGGRSALGVLEETGSLEVWTSDAGTVLTALPGQIPGTILTLAQKGREESYRWLSPGRAEISHLPPGWKISRYTLAPAVQTAGPSAVTPPYFQDISSPVWNWDPITLDIPREDPVYAAAPDSR